MGIGLSNEEGAVLHGILGDAAGDIVIRLNAHGFIDRQSDCLLPLGVDLTQMLFPPHVAELADSPYAGLVSGHYQSVMLGESRTGWIEFRTKCCGDEDQCQRADCGQWYALSLRRLDDEDGEPTGALGLLRSMQRVRSLEDELFASALTDPHTGLVNRQVFLARLREELRDGSGGCLAVLAIDRMRALFMQYGQHAADEINWGFAKFLQAMALPGADLAQLDSERFAVLLPGMDGDMAREWAGDLVETFSTLALTSSAKSPQLTASVGLANIRASVDATMRHAELALIMARAGGGDRVAQSGGEGAPSFRDITANCNARDDELGDRTLPR